RSSSVSGCRNSIGSDHWRSDSAHEYSPNPEQNMKITMRALSTKKTYDHNPRHNNQTIDAVAASIKEIGFRQPLVIDKNGVIVVGNTRYKAALKLGLTEVPVHVAIGLTPAQIKAYRLADNQTASLSQWNENLLALELTQLQEMNFDLSLTGLSGEELLR